jgi:hypothetical protein
MQEPVQHCQKCGGVSGLNAIVCAHCTEVFDEKSPSQRPWTYDSKPGICPLQSEPAEKFYARTLARFSKRSVPVSAPSSAVEPVKHCTEVPERRNKILRYASAAAIGLAAGFVSVFLYCLRIPVGCVASMLTTGAPPPGSPEQLQSLITYAISCSPSAALCAIDAGYFYWFVMGGCPLLLYLWDCSPKNFRPSTAKLVYTLAPGLFIGGVIILLVLEATCWERPGIVANKVNLTMIQLFHDVSYTFAGLSFGTYFSILFLGDVERLVKRSR